MQRHGDGVAVLDLTRQHAPGERSADVDVGLARGAGGSDLPADDAVAGGCRQFGLDRMALGARRRTQALGQCVERSAGEPVLAEQARGAAGIEHRLGHRRHVANRARWRPERSRQSLLR